MCNKVQFLFYCYLIEKYTNIKRIDNVKTTLAHFLHSIIYLSHSFLKLSLSGSILFYCPHFIVNLVIFLKIKLNCVQKVCLPFLFLHFHSTFHNKTIIMAKTFLQLIMFFFVAFVFYLQMKIPFKSLFCKLKHLFELYAYGNYNSLV